MDTRRQAVAAALRDRIHSGLHLGVLHEGDRLDSIRDVVATLHVRPQTALAAYRQLVAEGLVEVRARSGVFVASDASPRPVLPGTASGLVDFFLHALSRDVPPAEVLREMRRCIQMAPARAACLECNDDQVHALRRQLEADYGFRTIAVDADGIGSPGVPDRGLIGVDLVVTTRFHGPEARRLAQAIRRPVIEAVLDTSFFAQVRKLLAEGPLWWLCTDPRFARKLGRMWPGRPIIPWVLGADPLDRIPPDARVYATRRALERLPAVWRRKVVTARRAFSPETARALVAFRLKRSLARLQSPDRSAHR